MSAPTPIREAITRAAKAGVRTIEHGNLIDDASAKLMAEKGMFPGRQSRHLFRDEEATRRLRHGIRHVAKNDSSSTRPEVARNLQLRHGIPVAYGTDLLGSCSALVGGIHAPPHLLSRPRSSVGHHDRRPGGAHGGQARLLKEGAFADCSSSTATRSRI